MVAPSTAENALPWFESPGYRLRCLSLLPKSEFGDWLFALALFRHWHGRWPKRGGGTINDALFHLKTSSEITHPLRVYVSDKEYLKDYVRAKLGDQFNVTTMACLNSWKCVQRFDFPPRCFIKPTHLSGASIVRKVAETIDFGTIRKWFNTNFYDHSRERNYRTLIPKIIVEPFLFDSATPINYKIYCHNGEPRMTIVRVGTIADGSVGIYDNMWMLQPIYLRDWIHADHPQPANLDLMLHVARVLSGGFSLIRVDLYSDGTQVKVGELTNCPHSAGILFDSSESERRAARLLFGQE